MNKPALSVILPVFNGHEYLSCSIESILSQTFSNFELIIVNDGSTDDTEQIIKSFSDPRVVMINNKLNLGVACSLQLGVKKAQSEVIVRADGDDICDKERFQKQLDYLEAHPEVVLLGTSARVIDQNGCKVGEINSPETDHSIRRQIFRKNPFIHSSVMFRNSAYYKAGGYRKFFNGAEDYELWFRMLKYGKAANLGISLIARRVHGTSVTQQYRWKTESRAFLARLLHIFF